MTNKRECQKRGSEFHTEWAVVVLVIAARCMVLSYRAMLSERVQCALKRNATLYTVVLLAVTELHCCDVLVRPAGGDDQITCLRRKKKRGVITVIIAFCPSVLRLLVY